MTLDDLLGNLQPASYRGVPFGVLAAESRFGRSIALHEYPFKDTQWPEDLGRGTRKFSIQGFLITDSLVYGGGNVLDQRDKLVAAVETEGAATLVHPTFGRLQVSVIDDGLTVSEKLDAASYMEFTLLCVEAGQREFPSASTDSGDDSDSAADDLDDSADSDFQDDVSSDVDLGQSVIDMAVDTASTWVDTLNILAADATGIFNMAASLPGNFGRFFNGALVGFAAGLLSSPIVQTLAGLIEEGIQDRANVALAGQALLTAARHDEPAGVPPAARACVTALVACAQNPADGVRLLTQLASFYPKEPTGVSVIGQARATMQSAIGACLRRAALAGLVRVTATYNPQSEDDANNVRLTVCDLLDAEAVVAADAGDDASYKALDSCRGTVAADLDARGAKIPPMRVFTFAVPLPSLVIAQQLYQDASRADELVDEADARHPAFMPLSFRALSS